MVRSAAVAGSTANLSPQASKAAAGAAGAPPGGDPEKRRPPPATQIRRTVSWADTKPGSKAVLVDVREFEPRCGSPQRKLAAQPPPTTSPIPPHASQRHGGHRVPGGAANQRLLQRSITGGPGGGWCEKAWWLLTVSRFSCLATLL